MFVAQPVRAESEAEPRPPVGVIVDQSHAREMLELHPPLPVDECAIDVLERTRISRLRPESFGEELVRLEILEATGPLLRSRANRLAIDEVRDRPRILREGAVFHVADDGAVDVAVGNILVVSPPRHP